MSMIDEGGRAWARSGLIFGIIASVTGNIANVCLTDSDVSLGLLVPLAVVWPLGLFIAVEVLVRNRGVTGWLARTGQATLLTMAIPTAITSFLNLHALMIKAGEPGIAQLTGPLAIDGLMLGCTVMLLAAGHEGGLTPTSAQRFDYAKPIGPMPATPDWDTAAAALATEILPVPVSPAAPAAREQRERAERKPRTAGWDVNELARMLLDGTSKDADITTKLGIGASTLGRYRRAAKAIAADRNAVIPADWKVRGDVAQALRTLELTR